MKSTITPAHGLPRCNPEQARLAAQDNGAKFQLGEAVFVSPDPPVIA